MSVIQCGYYYTCWGISQQNRVLLKTVDQSKPINFRQIVVKDRSLSRICPATFPLGHLMVSKVPASQLLEHFAITRTSSPTMSQAFRLLDLILHCKEEPQLPDLYQFFFLCLFPLHSATKSYPRWSASLISLCISLFQDCILVLGTAYAAKIQRHYNLYKARSFLLESKLLSKTMKDKNWENFSFHLMPV